MKKKVVNVIFLVVMIFFVFPLLIKGIPVAWDWMSETYGMTTGEMVIWSFLSLVLICLSSYIYCRASWTSCR